MYSGTKSFLTGIQFHADFFYHVIINLILS